ncbi:MAG TPA: hypothetical protein VEJ45_10040 [Candidatus Acidoferrales bacterium]|nr:hypothetical protein [Candidatus Acidoferrales bacterium]
MSRSLFLLLGLACLATLCPGVMRAQEVPSQPVATAAPSAPEPPAKKVWTNEDVTTLREDSTISTVGAKTSAGPASGTSHQLTPGHQDAKWYSDQITKLQAQLPPINDKIAQLQAGIDGKFTGDSQTSTRPKNAGAGSWPIELEQLQKKRDDIESKINALRDQARHQGIPPNALP